MLQFITKLEEGTLPLFQTFLEDDSYYELRKEALERKIRLRQDLIPEILRDYATKRKEEYQRQQEVLRKSDVKTNNKI